MAKVFIVGAGIGGLEYLTIKAHRILTQAQALIYDALAEPSLLSLVPENCQIIAVGKRGGQESIAQSEINKILLAACQTYTTIVRLKSGDPMIFGRIVSEAVALAEAGFEFEIVSGISSAIAAPMLAGIPLTDVDLSPCFTVLSGHDLEILPWSALGQMPTLVILMGTVNLANILEKLKPFKPFDTPIALVQWAGRPHQKVWVGTLANILATLPHQVSPAVIVIGAVVNYHKSLMPAYHLPLRGKRILITRAAEQSSKFRQLLEIEGAAVTEMPTLVITPPSSYHALDQAIAQLQTYDWLILTSANAVQFFWQRLRDHHHCDSRRLHHLKIAVVGKKTAEALKSHGIVPDLIPPNFIADSLAQVFPHRPNLRILFPRVESGGREILITELTARGAEVDAVPVYESQCPHTIDETAWRSLQSQQIDIITFASSKTVTHFFQLMTQLVSPAQLTEILEPVKIAAIGTQTSQTSQKLLGRTDIEASEFTLEGLVQALIKGA